MGDLGGLWGASRPQECEPGAPKDFFGHHFSRLGPFWEAFGEPFGSKRPLGTKTQIFQNLCFRHLGNPKESQPPKNYLESLYSFFFPFSVLIYFTLNISLLLQFDIVASELILFKIILMFLS